MAAALPLLPLLPLLALLAACQNGAATKTDASAFPEPNRPVANVVATQFSNEPAREAANEAQIVMDWADTRPGMTVADIGAGEVVQFERLGYFCMDQDSTLEKPVFNRTVGLRDSFAKAMAKG